jgi:enterochelin esterase-like enzyme
MSPTAGEFVTEALPYDGGPQVTVYAPRDPVETVVFAADGAWHTTRLSEALEGAGMSSTMVVGVHGLPDDNGRLHEYVPGFDAERFTAHERFFVDDVRRWLDGRFGISLPAERTAVWGASLGAEFALAMGLRHPEAYGAVLAASPGSGYQPPDVWPSPLPRVYLVAGRQEQFFLDNASRWADALRRADADVVMMQRDGEHGGKFWGEEFPLMVAWAFGR